MTKRLFDIVISAFALVVLMPVLASLALAIRLRMGGPVLFRQARTGQCGCTFRIAKFRTMTDGRDRAGNLLPDGERLTALGALMRRTSLDELPQLWNVLKGDMSLVGPRPLLPEYLPRYNAFQRRRHAMKPGITGWAQVNGRNALTWEKKFELDVWYVEHSSRLLDFKILWMTLAGVLRREGISQAGHATMSEFMGSEIHEKNRREETYMSGLILWGAGGHGKVVLDCAILSARFSPIAFLDDAGGDRFCGHEVLGGSEQLPSAAQRGFCAFLIAIGDNHVRARCFNVSCEYGLQPATLVHPSAIVSPSAVLSPGTVVMPRVVINAGAVIGQNCIINTGAIVEHDCRIGDHVHISPGVLLGGNVQVRDYAHVGIGAIALPGADIGEGAVVGGGAVVPRSVAPGTTVVGVPAKVRSHLYA